MAKGSKRVKPPPRVRDCLGCRRPYNISILHQCPARDWLCPTCNKYGHLDGVCEALSGKALSYKFPKAKKAYPYEHVPEEEWLRDCDGCNRPYTELHRCPASNWRCQDCKQLGHLDGLCEQGQNKLQWHNEHNFFGYHAEIFNFSHANLMYPNPYEQVNQTYPKPNEPVNPTYPKPYEPYEPVDSEEFCESTGRGDSCEVAYEEATPQAVKQEHHTKPGTSNTKKRSAEHTEPCNEVPGRKRRRHNDTLNFFKGHVETLREENNQLKQQYNSAKNTCTNTSSSLEKEGETSRVENASDCVETLRVENEVLKQQCNSAKNTNTISSLEKEAETSRVETEKTNELKTSLNKPINELIAEFEDTKADNAQLKSQRDQLFACYQKLEAHTRKVVTRVDHLIAQHRYIMDHAYTGFPTANLPPWCHDTCKRCGSSQRHEEFDCAANGYMCQQCFMFNHFTAMCMDAPSHRFTATPEEKNVLARVKADIAASK